MNWTQTLTTILVSIASALISLAVAWGGVKAHLENGNIHEPGVQRQLEEQHVITERIEGKVDALASALAKMQGYLEARKENTQ